MKKALFSYINCLFFLLYPLCASANNFTTAEQAATDSFKQQKGVVLNVKDLGAVGDNVKDDGAAIQKALDKAATLNGATVYFPDGVYLIQNPGNGDSEQGKYGLRVGSHTTLELSANAVLHKRGNEDIIANKDWTNGNSNIIITGGTFKGDSGAEDKWAPTRTGIRWVNVSHSKIKKCSFQHIGNSAISIQKNSFDNTVSNCKFTDIFNCGIELFGKQNIASNNYLHDMGSDGILVKGDECTVIKNKLVNIGSYSAPSLGSSISLGADNIVCKNNKVINNTIEGAAAHGIINDRSANTLIQGNIISNTGHAAIKIGGDGKSSQIRKNIIKNAGLSKDRSGIYVNTGIVVDGAGVIIEDNKLSNITGTGIFVNKDAVNTIVKRCRVSTTKKPKLGEIESTAIQVKAANVSVKSMTARKTSYKLKLPGK